MIFRRPFQIFRTAFKGLKCLTEQIKTQEFYFSKREYSPIDLNNNHLPRLATAKRNVSSSYPVQKYIKHTNLANKKNGLKKRSKCTCTRKCPRQLASVDNCSKYVDVLKVPVTDLSLRSLQADNGASKFKWTHFCPEDICKELFITSKLGRPKLKYEPTIDKPRKKMIDLSHLDPSKMHDVSCWKKKISSINCNSHCKHLSTLALSRVSFPKHSYKYKIMQQKTRLYGKKSGKGNKPDKGKKSDKGKKDECNKCVNKSKGCNECNKPPKDPCKKPKCECKPKPKKCVTLPPCPNFKCKPCKPRTRHICPEYVEDHNCKKVEAPYDSYGDTCASLYEDPISECVNENEVMLQPQKQVSKPIKVITPALPKFAHIDPEKERKCLAEKLPDPEPLPDTSECWVNPCPQLRVCPCKPRSRKLCREYEDKCCTKLHAPYKSFADQCPQFPEVEIDECKIVEKIQEHYMVSYKKQQEKECEKSKTKGKVDRSVRCGTKVKDVNADHTCEEVVIPTWASRRVRCTKSKTKIVPKSDKCKRPGKGTCGKCCSEKPKPVKKVSKCSKIASTIKAFTGDKKKKPQSPPTSSCSKPKVPPKDKYSEPKGGKCNQPKSRCPDPPPNTCEKDKNGKYKTDPLPNPKCGRGQKKSGTGCKNPKKKFSGGHSQSKILKGRSGPCIREPITKPTVLKFSTLSVPQTSKPIWEKDCEYFQLRPDVPSVYECKENSDNNGILSHRLQTQETDCNLSFCPSDKPKDDLVLTEMKKSEELIPTKLENLENCIPDGSPILKTQNCKPTVASTLNRDIFMNSDRKDLLKPSVTCQQKNRYFSTLFEMFT